MMKIDRISKKRLIKVLCWGIVLIALYVCIFHVNVLFVPLRNRPDQIVVYKYGETAAYKPEDTAFQDLYKLLKPCVNATISDYVSGKVGLAEMRTMIVPDPYMTDAMMIRVTYNQEQNTRFLGDNPYKDVYYILDSPEDLVSPYYGYDYYIVYETLDREGHYCAMTKIPFPQKAKEYVSALSL